MAPTPSNNNNYIQQGLESLNKKFDDFIASMPNTYVSMRHHELQIKAHEERLIDNAKRLDALETSLETWKNTASQWSVNQHDAMRKEWTGEVKDVNAKLDSVETSVTSVEKSVLLMTEQQGHQTKVLTWILGVFTTLILTTIGGIIMAILTHLIHF